MMAVDVTTQPAFSAGKPKVLFEGRYAALDYTSNYDVTPDGQRFIMIKESGREIVVTQFNVVLNWFEELQRRVPVRK